MEWLKIALLLFVGYWIGTLVASYSSMQILISTGCALPVLRMMEPYKHCFDIASCKKLFRTTIVVHTLIAIAAAALTILFAPHYLKIGICVGYLLALFLGRRQYGINDNNLADTITIIGKRVYPGHEDELRTALVNTFGIKE